MLVKGVNGDWASVDVGGQSGYMYVKYLGSEGTTHSTAYVKTNSRGLNLRAEPNGNILGSYPRGTKVTVLSNNGNWSKVSVDGKTGYMQTQWLSTKSVSSGSSTVKPATGTAVVNNPRDTQVLFLRLRSQREQRIAGLLSQRQDRDLLARQGDWYKVSVDGKTGFMMAKYLKVTSEVVSGTARVFNANGGSYVNFRSRASLSASVIGTVPVGTTVKVLEKTTDWTKVEVNGQTGYISTWFLKF